MSRAEAEIEGVVTKARWDGLDTPSQRVLSALGSWGIENGAFFSVFRGDLTI